MTKQAQPTMDLGFKQQSDEELMIAYVAGSEYAFRKLYERYSSKMYGFMISKLKNRSMADDALQAAFMKLHQSRVHYDSTLPFAPWLFTICRTALLDTLRVQHRNSRLEDKNLDGNDVLENSTEPTPLPNLSDLPPHQRQALDMRYLQDLSFDEIAARLETSSENSRQLVSRGIKKIRQILRGNGNEL